MAIMTDGAVGSAEKADGMAAASVGTADFTASPSGAVASTAEAVFTVGEVSKVEAGPMKAVGSMVAEVSTVGAGSTAGVGKP